MTTGGLSALSQTWPPFALVTGLLLIGAAAEREGLFAWLARPAARLSPLAALAVLLLVDALVTAIMNLDTAAAFMTPIMLYAARGLGTDGTPFLYGAVLMANAASLYLPGSNLTNLLVEGGQVSGADFAADLLPAALIATAVTAAGLLAFAGLRGQSPQSHQRDSGDSPLSPAKAGAGCVAVVVAAVLVVVLREPALPVLALGLVAAALSLDLRTAVATVGPRSLVALFTAAVAVGTLARGIDLTVDAGRTATAAIGAATSVTINNLPAASLLSANPPPPTPRRC